MPEGTTLDLYRTMNAGYAQAIYEQYLRDPASVDSEWRQLFENGGTGFEPVSVPAAVTAGASVARLPAAGGTARRP